MSIKENYFGLKNNEQDTIFLYPVGDFFEIIGEDAKKIANVLDLIVGYRKEENEYYPVIGFYKDRISMYINMLRDKKYNVQVGEAYNDGSISTYVLPAHDGQEDSFPVGRIDYLDNNGYVKESVYYTSEYCFKKDIKEESYYGAPMNIVFYRNKEGNFIDSSFIHSMDTPVNGIEYTELPEYSVKEKEKRLVETLNVARDAYYNDSNPVMSDREYDDLYDMLEKIEEETGVIFVNSPTQTVGYEVKSELKEVTHNHPLLSLAKTTDVNEFVGYFEKEPFAIMGKMDGLTCSLVYDNGMLVSAETRGNGIVGEDILHNAKTFINLPLTIPYKERLIVDGEAIIDTDTFNSINEPLVIAATKEAIKKGLTGEELDKYVHEHSYANPRNLVAGTVRQLDSSVCASRKVKFIAWHLHDDDMGHFLESAYFLIQMGFEFVPFDILEGSDVDICENRMYKLKDKCEAAGYPIDGLVGTFDDLYLGLSKGATSHHFKHSLAFKFYQESVETTLTDVEWNVTRTGAVNPVAIFKPVNIDGTNVTRATLNNVTFIKKMKLGIGDTIQVKKANQIIPQITENITMSNNLKLPEICPVCLKPLLLKNDNGSEMLYCTNDDCFARRVNKFVHFVSRDGMDIEGLSEATLEKFVDKGFITEFSDIFNLISDHGSEIEKMEGFGKKSVNKLDEAIEKSRHTSFVPFICSLGIPNIGKGQAKLLLPYVKEYVKVNNISGENYGDSLINGLIAMAWEDYDFTKIEGIGKVLADNLYNYFKPIAEDAVVYCTTNTFTDLMWNVIFDDKDDTNKNNESVYTGKTFCITGKLNSFANREALVADIESKGGKVVSGVTSKTNYLITNDPDSGSSKNKKAKECGTKIITEEEYIKNNI